MATRKETRERVRRKREEYMALYRAEGLRALQKDKARRFREKLKEWEKVHNEKHFKFVDECPHCLVVRSAAKKEPASG